MLMTPALLLRKRRIISRLQKVNAYSMDTAKSLEEAGVIHPYMFKRLTNQLVKDGILVEVGLGKYYLNRGVK